MKHLLLGALTFGVLLSGCKDPAGIYLKTITDTGFIPFKQPMGNIGSGTLVRGKPSEIYPMGPPTTCFPDKIDGKETKLRWESDADLAQTHYNATIDFNAKLNSIAAMGTPSLQFKLGVKNVRKVDFEVSGVTVERINQLELVSFYRNQMSEECRDRLVKSPFILDALQAKQMSFTFYNEQDGQVEINAANISEFADFGVNVQWHIENSYKLVITTPKFLGYRLAQLRNEDNGLVDLVSSKVNTKKDLFLWTDLGGQ